MTECRDDKASWRSTSCVKVKRRFLFGAFLLPFLVACHADATVRLDLRGDGTTLVRTKEVIDDDLYKLALSEDASGDPFYTERMRRDGWLIQTSVDGKRNRVITMSKVVGGNQFEELNHESPMVRGISQSLGSFRVSRAPGLLFERDSLSATIAPVMPLISSAYGRFLAGIASQVLGSVLALHLEVKTPGTLLATNGQILPDGAVRWDLNLTEPTTVWYSARMVNIYHVAVGILVTLLLGFAISAARFRSRLRTLRPRLRP